MGLAGGFCHIKKTILLLVLGGEVTNIESTKQEDERDLYKKDINWFEPAIVRVVINNSCCFEMIGSKTVRKQDQNPAIEEVIPHQSSTWWPLLPITCTKSLHAQKGYATYLPESSWQNGKYSIILYSFSISDQWPASAAVFSCHLWTSSPVWRQTPQSGLLWSWLTAAHLSIKSLARKVAFWVWKSEHHFFRQWCTLYVKRSAKTAHLTMSDPTAMT